MGSPNYVPAPGTGGLYVPGGGGWTGALSNLFKNKLLLQFLGAAGQDFMSNSPGLATNAALQQNISSQGMMKLLSGLLSGNIPGAKMSVDEEGYSFKAPHPPKPSNEGGAIGNANPFGSSQSGFSASDLAGVSPEMISQALQLKQNQDQIAQKSFTDIVDAMYKGGMADYYSRMAGVAEAGVPIDQTKAETDRFNAIRQLADEFRESPIEVPGVGKVDLKTWNAMEPKTQAYSYYVFDQKMNKQAPLTYDAWIKQADQAVMEKYYRLAKTDPAFKQFLFEYQKSGATRISLGEKVAEKLALSEVEARTQLDDPRQLQGAIDNALSAKDIISSIRLADTPEEGAKIKARETVKAIEGMIATGKGVVTEAYIDKDGRTGVWVVQWPNGDVRTYRHAIK